MCGDSESRGFTLLEVLVVISFIVVTFTALFAVLSSAMEEAEANRVLFEDMLVLDKKLKLGLRTEVRRKERRLPNFPRVREVTYFYKDVFFVKYVAR